MRSPLRVVLVEDDARDAELLLREIRRGGFEPTWERVDTEEGLLAALEGEVDIVLSDYDLPEFDGLRALELVHSRRPDVPFIIVSGTIGEETAVAAMRKGAADYLLKDRLTRLGQAMSAALEQKRLRTEQRRLEAMRQRSQQLESLGTLAGGIAHDFNNILLAIDGHIMLATGDLPPDHPVQENLGEIGRASARAAALVRQILTFGRPHDVSRETLDLGAVVQEALKLVRATLPAMIEIRTSYGDDGLSIEGDATQIHQIVVNLSTNAAHAMGPRGGAIDVSLARVMVRKNSVAPGVPPNLGAGEYACLTVTDNGSGMSPETLERIFDPFYTTKAPGIGTGLGLSVVHGIVTSHGGAIAVESQLSVGSTFRLYFPIAASPRTTNATERTSAPVGQGQRVLYVDDEPALVSVAVQVLSRLGYVVTGHTDALRALADFRTRPQEFDAVVTDLSMPGLSGLELATHILAARPDLPILMTSGYAPPEEHEAAAKLGVRELIPKPTLVTEIGHALGRVLQRDARVSAATMRGSDRTASSSSQAGRTTDPAASRARTTS